jgi:hypothetical protein
MWFLLWVMHLNMTALNGLCGASVILATFITHSKQLGQPGFFSIIFSHATEAGHNQNKN